MNRYAFCFALLFIIWGGGFPGTVRADDLGDTLADMGADPQVQNAGEALQNALSAWASRGHATRGADGILGELATNSGELICQTGIIRIRLHIRDMIIENGHLGGEEQIEHLQLIQRAQRFAADLERECAKAGFLGEVADDSGSAGGDGGGATPPPEPRPAGTPIERRPGETVADAICRQRCQREFNRLYDRRRWEAEAEERKLAADERLAAARTRIPELTQEVQAAQQELDRLNSIIRVAYNGSWSQARKNQWREAQTQSHLASGRVEDALADLAAAEADLANAEAAQQNEEADLAHHRLRTASAQQAYDDCLRRCLTQAADAKDPTTTVCPAPAAHKSVSVGPNDKVGSRAQLGSDIKKSLGGGASLGGLLGGSSGGTFGSKKANPVPNRAGSGGSKAPETADDPIDDDDKVAQEVGDTELEVGAQLVSDGLLVSSHIDEAPGDGTFQAIFLEDAYGRRMTPDRYDIYDLWREWTLTVWWTYDRWVDGQHVEHQEGGWSESERETMQLAALRPGEAEENGIWSRLGFSSAAKGIQTLGAHFALKPEDLSEPVDLVIHTTLPDEDPVTTQPAIYRLTLQNGKDVKLEPVTGTLAMARNCY